MEKSQSMKFGKLKLLLLLLKKKKKTWTTVYIRDVAKKSVIEPVLEQIFTINFE